MREQMPAEPGSRLDHFSTPETSRPTSSRLSDYSLVKEQLAPVKERYILTPPDLKGSSPQAFFDRFPSRGRGSYRAIRLCQSAGAKKIPPRPIAVFRFRMRITSQLSPIPPQFRHHGQTSTEWKVTNER